MMVHNLKKIGVALCVVAVILAASLPAMAIGFDTDTVYNSVFVITSGNALGSGFAIGTNAVVTNAHVIDNPYSVLVKDYGGEEYDAFVVAMDETLDIALLGVYGVNFTPLKTKGIASLKVGDDVYAVGAPRSLSYTLTKGVVSARERNYGGQTYIQTDAAINHGNSGGPLLSDAGEVVGVNTLKMDDSEGLGLAIPIDRVLEYIKGEGVLLNNDGNVSGGISSTEKPTATNADGDIVAPSKTTPDDAQTIFGLSVTTFVLIVALGVSVVLNIVLLIALAVQKRKDLYYTSDPSTRTDFEIDILE